jgi:phenylalanine-4-hydroxylase
LESPLFADKKSDLKRDTMTNYVAKWPNDAGLIDFSETENQTWKTLYERQIKTIQNRACKEFITGLDELNLSSDCIPQIPDLNRALEKTGWKYKAVAGTIDVEEFFDMLAHRTFPVANFIRIPEELDYLQQPDIFHEYFGHGPLLMNPVYADFVQWYGETAQKMTVREQRFFSRLFWFTIEFGLIKSSEGVRVLGGGILSSHAETIFSLESDEPARLSFDLEAVLAMPYDYKKIQPTYYVIDGFEALYALSHGDRVQKLFENLSGDQDSFLNC